MVSSLPRTSCRTRRTSSWTPRRGLHRFSFCSCFPTICDDVYEYCCFRYFTKPCCILPDHLMKSLVQCISDSETYKDICPTYTTNSSALWCFGMFFLFYWERRWKRCWTSWRSASIQLILPSQLLRSKQSSQQLRWTKVQDQKQNLRWV